MSDVFEYKGYSGSIESSVKDRCFYGKVLFITDLVTYEGQTYDELEEAFRIMVDDYIATCAEIGKSPQRPFKGSFNVRVSPELHRQAAIVAHREGISLNELTSRAIDKYINAPEVRPLTVVNHTHNHHHELRSYTQTGTYSISGGDEWTTVPATPPISH